MKIKINENIRTYRKALGLTQEQLAEAVGVTVGAVSKWESGLSYPDINMIVVLADFFEISVDVLLGYQWRSMNIGQAIEHIKKLYTEKRYEEGTLEVEKALQKYPNNFDVVYHSARLYQFKGFEFGDRASAQRALVLYNRACSLIKQNTNEEISELYLQNCIAEIYCLLGDTELAVKHLKKYNYEGVNNGKIGVMLALQHQNEEALPYLSESLLSCVTELIRTTVGFANSYSDEGNDAMALDILLWMRSIISGLKISNEVSYIEKVEAALLSGCAQICVSMKRYDEAKEYLKEAKKPAERFDKEPNYDLSNIKYIFGKEHTVYDDFGGTAMQGILKSLIEDETISPILTKIWEDIMNEEAK